MTDVTKDAISSIKEGIDYLESIGESPSMYQHITQYLVDLESGALEAFIEDERYWIRRIQGGPWLFRSPLSIYEGGCDPGLASGGCSLSLWRVDHIWDSIPMHD